MSRSRARSRACQSREGSVLIWVRTLAQRPRAPDLEGRTYTFLGYQDPTNVGVLNNPDDTAAELFARLGLEISDGALATPTEGAQGLVSMEEVETVDADVLFVVYLDESAREKVESHALFQGLDAVREGRYFGATLEQGSALRGPTVLTGAWVLEQLEPFLSGLEF